MTGKLLKIKFYVVWSIVFITNVSFVSSNTPAHGGNPSISHSVDQNVKRSKVVRDSVCNHHLIDGTPYKGPCRTENPTVTKEQEVTTDIEVEDLTKSPNTHVIAEHVKVSTTPQITPNKEELSFDELVAPQEKPRPNSKFNLAAGGIVAVICVTVALASYAGIMMWKRIVMNAYQNREVLLNDDDIGDINDEDMRHFEAACIEIEA